MSNSEATTLAAVTQSEKIKLDPAEQCLNDCATLTAMQLRRRYPAEASSHRNMLQRKQKRGLVHPAFHDFRSFLRHVGPCTCRGATLDRTNNTDPEYAPGKVRWADKRPKTTTRATPCCFFVRRPASPTPSPDLPSCKTFPPARSGSVRKGDGLTTRLSKGNGPPRPVRAPLVQSPPGHDPRARGLITTSANTSVSSGRKTRWLSDTDVRTARSAARPHPQCS
ncbi:hypothetical protein ABIF79_010046 [Bradyrhizobium japonicum]